MPRTDPRVSAITTDAALLTLALAAGGCAASVRGASDAGDEAATTRDGAGVDAVAVDGDAIDGGPRPVDGGPRPVDAGPDVPRTDGCVGSQQRCGANCVDVTISPFHCGGCGRRCPAGQVCTASVCRAPCVAPQMTCGAQCLDVSSDPANCGGCGRACPAGATCISGRCRSPNDPTYAVARVPLGAVVDACAAPGARRLFPNTRSASEIVPLPFAFRFWGGTLPAGAPVNVCTNGWIGMDGMRSVASFGRFPPVAPPYGVVAAHWTSVSTRDLGVCVATVGAAPARRFVVEWRDAYYCCATTSMTHLTFQIVLSEADGSIEVAFPDVRMARPAWLGVSSLTGADAVTPCTMATGCTVATGERYRFTPRP